MKSNDICPDVPYLLIQNIEIFICPSCSGDLKVSRNRQRIECTKCNQSFRLKNGIPLLFWSNEWDSKPDVTEIVKSFYEENPFPSYEDTDSIWSLREKAEKGIFAYLLDKQIPHNSTILEVGCGTGQLSNFLGLNWGMRVFATDISLNSLKISQEFKEKNKIDNVAFLQMNLFRPVFRSESFDLVICNGVLHHTSDPFLGFQTILKLTKKGGFIIVGLYNAYGRIPNKIKRAIFSLSGNFFKFLDTRSREKYISKARKLTWIKDQYKNPHESTHTIGEVLSWFNQSGVGFVNSIPKFQVIKSFSSEEKLFKQNPKGTRFDHLIIQLNMLLNGGKEGGFFIIIGRREV